MYLHFVTLMFWFWLLNKIVLQLDGLQPQLSLWYTLHTDDIYSLNVEDIFVEIYHMVIYLYLKYATCIWNRVCKDFGAPLIKILRVQLLGRTFWKFWKKQ